MTAQIKKAVGIGQPIIRLNDELNSDEIRLEGAEVSRDTYASLFAIYGTTYGAGDGVLTFNLPDFRDRTIWGSDSFGYVEAGLPNITGKSSYRTYTQGANNPSQLQNGCIIQGGDNGSWWGRPTSEAGGNYFTHLSIDASKSNDIYGNADTVRPPAIKVRVVTRYK